MTLPPELSSAGIRLLNQLGFSLTESSDHGMRKSYLWSNSRILFSLTYDRGYCDCDLCLFKAEPEVKVSLIPLLKFLKNDRTFYNKELKKANLWNTLTPDGYVELFYREFDMINIFFGDYHAGKFENYKKFDYDYDGI